MLRQLTRGRTWRTGTVLGLGLFVCFSIPTGSNALEFHGRKGMILQSSGTYQERRSGRWVADNDKRGKVKNYQTSSPEEKTGIEKNIREWKSLPPETQNILRQRLNQWKELPAEDRTLYKKRFDQLHQLSPEERQGVRKKLDQWDNLSPKEKEEIRKKFPAP